MGSRQGSIVTVGNFYKVVRAQGTFFKNYEFVGILYIWSKIILVGVVIGVDREGFRDWCCSR